MRQFTHLHLHTEYSLLDGACKISELAKNVYDKGMRAVAITDHGNIMALYKAQTAFDAFNKNLKEEYKNKLKEDPNAKEPEYLKLLMGSEFYVAHDMTVKGGMSINSKERYHLILIAKNEEGYRNLVKLSSLSYTEGFYSKPRIDLNLLEKHSKGLICLSACIQGQISQMFLQQRFNAAYEHAEYMKNLFGEDYYLEIQNHDLPDQKFVNPKIIEMAKKLNIKLIATNDVHYLNREDAESHDVLLCIQTGKNIEDPTRLKFNNDQYYLKTYDEMLEIFPHVQEALDNTQEIVDKCNVVITPHKLFPPYRPSTGETAEEFLRRISYEGLEKRYKTITDEIRERADIELGVIISMGFAEYYLIVWDFIYYAKSKKIPVGPGRGSGVGSIIAYAIGITDVDPLKYNLIFDRFLNPERVSNPDFDIDFCFARRHEVIEYVIEKYGQEKVCQIITFGTLAARNVFKSVAKVYGMSFEESNKYTKFISPKASLDQVLGIKKPKPGEDDFSSAELIDLYNNNVQIKKILDVSRKLEGMPKNTGTHAAGVVICKEVISDYVPLYLSGGFLNTQFTKDEVEKLGMLKMDFLALNTLTDIDLAKKYVQKKTGEVINFNELGYEDPNVYELIASGDTYGVFQLESGGMQKFMKNYKPSCMEDIIAGISLYRPGPMENIDKYIQCKRNPELVKYLHPKLEKILNVTYGYMVYQEQVMQIVKELAGYSFGGADAIRRIMSKKKPKEMEKEKVRFLYGYPETKEERHPDGTIKIPYQAPAKGAVNMGVSEEVATKIYEEMSKFAAYAFNKSHAAAYAHISYQTAYLKRYHFLEFITAMLNNRISKFDDLKKYLYYLMSKDIRILPPDINKSGMYFSVENNAVRFGMLALKEVGEKIVDEIIGERDKNGEYKSFEEMVRRLDVKSLQKKTLIALVQAGAFRSCGQNISTLMIGGELYIKNEIERRKTVEEGQLTLFDLYDINLLGDAQEEYESIEVVQEYPLIDVLRMEKNVCHMYITGHPLESYKDLVEKEKYFTLFEIVDLINVQAEEKNDDNDEEEQSIDEEENVELSLLKREYDKKQVKFLAEINDLKIKKTKTGNEIAIMNLSDQYGTIAAVMFNTALKKFKSYLNDYSIAIFSGRLDLDKDAGKPQIMIDVVEILKVDEMPNEVFPIENDETFKKIYFNWKDLTNDTQNKLIEILRYYPGNVECCKVVIDENGNKKAYKLMQSIDFNYACKLELDKLIGEENYKASK